jgi:5-oxopent-3-ene-1,2,5-tricarboxylate decarboxylase/2-hydroxyhepta-2,4-diene-1,7-dioate isomerase
MQGASAKRASDGVRGDSVPVGTVYGVVLNDQRSLEKLGAVLDEAPYKGRPRAPILYIKPRNTHSSGNVVKLPRNATAVEIGATLGVVIGVEAARVSVDRASEVIQGYMAVADISLPHQSYYRPAIREKCFDGSCLMMPAPVPAATVESVEQLVVSTTINGNQVDVWALSELVRSVPQLIADVTDFMTLQRGDVLLVGVSWNAPQAVPGDLVKVEIKNVGTIEFEIESPMEGEGQ